MKTIEELVQMTDEEFKAEKEQMVQQAKDLMEQGKLDEATAIVELIEKAIKQRDEAKPEDKPVVSNDEPKPDADLAKRIAEVEKRSLDTTRMEVRAISNGVKTVDVPIKDAILALNVKSSFNTDDLVTVVKQKAGGGKLPETEITGHMVSTDELLESPEMAKNTIGLDSTRFSLKTYRQYLGLSLAFIKDSLGEQRDQYITAIANQTIANTKLVNLKNAIEAVNASTELTTADQFISALSDIEGVPQLVANKANIAKIVKMLGDNVEHVITDNQHLVSVQGLTFKLVEMPKRITDILLFSANDTKMIMSVNSPDTMKLTELPESAGGVQFYGDVLRVTSRHQFIVDNGYSFTIGA